MKEGGGMVGHAAMGGESTTKRGVDVRESCSGAFCDDHDISWSDEPEPSPSQPTRLLGLPTRILSSFSCGGIH